MAFIEDLKTRSIAEQQSRANEQHYEVPTEFMMSCLGSRAKYSACLYPTGRETLAQAEEACFEEYCVKARLEDGLEVLDLGCGKFAFDVRSEGECYESYIDLYYYHYRMGKFDLVSC